MPGDRSEPIKLSPEKEYILQLGDRISLSGKCYVYRLVAPNETRDLTRSTSTLAPEVYSNDTDREDNEPESRDLTTDRHVSSTSVDSVNPDPSMTPVDVSTALLNNSNHVVDKDDTRPTEENVQTDDKNSNDNGESLATKNSNDQVDNKNQNKKKRKNRKDSNNDDVASDGDWGPSRDKKKRKKESGTNKEDEPAPTRATRPQRARATWIAKYVDQIALRGYSFSARHKIVILYDESCLTHIVPEWHLEKPEVCISLFSYSYTYQRSYSD